MLTYHYSLSRAPSRSRSLGHAPPSQLVAEWSTRTSDHGSLGSRPLTAFDASRSFAAIWSTQAALPLSSRAPGFLQQQCEYEHVPVASVADFAGQLGDTHLRGGEL